MIAAAIVELGGPHPQAGAMRGIMLAVPGALALLGSRVVDNLLLPLLPAPRCIVPPGPSAIVYKINDANLPTDISQHFSTSYGGFVVRRTDLDLYIAEHPDRVHSYDNGVACLASAILDADDCCIYAKIYSGVLHFVLVLDRDREYLPGNCGVPGRIYDLRDLLYTSVFGGIVPIATLPCGLVFGRNYETGAYGISNGRRTITVGVTINVARPGVDDLGRITALNGCASLYEYTFQYAKVAAV